MKTINNVLSKIINGSSAILLLLLLVSLASYSQEEKVLKQVYNSLIQSIGNQGQIAPDIALVESERFVASFSPSKNSIKFERKAYEICTSFGKDSLNAMAYILAHELGHFYKDHGWLREAGSAYASMEFGKQLKKSRLRLDTLKIYESQADEFAGFYGHVAGYNVLGVAPEVLEKIYKEYDLPNKLPKYPSLDERIKIAEIAKDRMNELIPLFEFSLESYAIGEYSLAVFGFQEIAKEFPSREMFNNIGVCNATMALTLFDKDSVRLIYPFEIDANSRLYENNERGLEEDKEELKKELLDRAIYNFKKAVSLDPNYFYAYINLSLCSDLLKSTRDADYFLGKAEDLIKEDKTRSSISLGAKGLLAYNSHDIKQAKKLFKEAGEMGNDIASLNLEILKGKSVKKSPGTMSQIEIKRVDGVDLQSYGFEKEMKNSKTIKGKLSFGFDHLPNSDYCKAEFKSDEYYKLTGVRKRYVSIQFVHNLVNEPLLNFNSSSNKEDIIKELGSPDKIIHYGEFKRLVYNNLNLIIHIKDNAITGYSKYFSY